MDVGRLMLESLTILMLGEEAWERGLLVEGSMLSWQIAGIGEDD